jgi:hypothetical protein
VEALVSLALGLSKEEFVNRFPEPILVGDGAMDDGHSAWHDRRASSLNWEETMAGVSSLESASPEGLVLLVRKTQRTFLDMIKIGRAATNDIVIPDESVSKFHAYFELIGDNVALADARSTNGTWVGDTRLPPDGDPVAVNIGDRVRFADFGFTLMHSLEFWEFLRTPPKPR